MCRPLRITLLSLVLLMPFVGISQEPQAPPSGDATGQATNPSTGIPTFYAHSRQVIVEAEVWDKSTKKGEHPWIGNEPLSPLEKDAAEHLPPVARGLTASEFHIFDNGVKQSINYFKETDFPAVDVTDQWSFFHSIEGTWGIFNSGKHLAGSSASYLIGYTPSAIGPGECHAVRVAVEGRRVQINRTQYCALQESGVRDIDAIAGKKLGTRMFGFASSSAHGLIKVSMQAFAFWSSGVLRLASEAPQTSSVAAPPTAGYMYEVYVHDSMAPTRVQIAAGFKVSETIWPYPCRKDAVIYILGIAYKTNGGVAAQFADTYKCGFAITSATPAFQGGGTLIPTWFGGQINLSPGDYDIRIVVSDGHDFGRAEVPLHVQALDATRLMISDIVVGGVLRGAGWVLREAASVSPSPVVPTPLISKDIQFFPEADAPPRLGKHSPLFLYFEVYEPLPINQKPAVYYRAKITDLKTSALVMNTDPLSAADWVLPGNAVVPIGLKLATEKLEKGSYRLELQASDSAGRQTEWRQTTFTIQ